MRQLEEITNSLSISDCDFENEKGTTNSIYFVSNKRENNFEINNCNFKGKLSKGSKYIDGKLIDENAPKINIKSCSFEYDINQSINIDLINEESTSIETIKPINRSRNIIPYLFMIILILVVTFLMLKNKFIINDDKDNYFEDKCDDQIESSTLIDKC